MSSPPILDLEVAGGAAAGLRPAGHTVAAVEAVRDEPLVRRAPLPADAERIFTAVAGNAVAASNVIELDAPQLRAAGRSGRSGAAALPRVDLRRAALGLQLSETAAVAAAGLFTFWLQPQQAYPLDLSAAFAALAVMAVLVRLSFREVPRLDALRRRAVSRQVADGALRTLLPFVVSVFLAVVLVPSGDAFHAPLTHWLTLWAMGAVAGVAAVRLGLAGLVARWRRQGRLRQTIAIFGSGDLAERLLDRLQAAACADTIELIGLFDDRARRRIASPSQRSLALGTAEDLVALSRHRDIDRVIVALPHAAEHRVLAVLKKLRQMPVEISLAPDHVGYKLVPRDADDLAGLPMLDVHGQPLTFAQILLKGVLDKLLAASLLVLGLPLFLALTAAIKLDSRGPVFFRQNRDGFGDRVIGVYKFRTMYADAADHDCRQQTQRNDPRVTRIGGFLRRWSLDELPQLLNVLRGEMSLVGPRPHAISMCVEERPNRDIVPDYAMRHHVKPGITGWAQVNGYHGPVETEEALRARVRYDLEYIDNWSLWFDFRILLRTLALVLGRRRAY